MKIYQINNVIMIIILQNFRKNLSKTKEDIIIFIKNIKILNL